MSPRKLKPCGTAAAAMRHLRHGEQLCEPCRLARNAAAIRNYHRRNAGLPSGESARSKALSILAGRHLDEYREILAQVRADAAR